MSWLIRVFIGLVVAVAVLQWAVPRTVAGLVAEQAARADGGVKPVVDITAIPFWELADGKFEDVYMAAHNISVDGMQVAGVRLDWRNAQLAPGALWQGRLEVAKPGQLTVTIRVDQVAMSQFLATKSPIQHPVVTISPQGVTIVGAVTLHGITLPVNASGTLEVSPDRQKIVFHPVSFDGLAIPVMTDLTLVDLSSLVLPVPIAIRSVTLHAGYVVIAAQTP